MKKSRYLLVALVLMLLAGASAAQLRQVAIIDIPGNPGFDSLAFANGHLVIAHRGANAVDIFDPVKRRLKLQVSGMSDPRGIAVDEAGKRVYVANAGSNSLAVLSTQDWKVEATISLPHSPAALLLTGTRLYIANNRDPSVSVFDIGRHALSATVDLGGRPQQMVFDPIGQVAFVNVEDRNEVVALGPDHRIAKRFRLAGSQPTGIAIDPKFRRLFVAVRYAVLVLDAGSGSELARIPAAAGIDRLWFDESNGSLYAAASDGSVNMIHTQGEQFISEHELQTQVRGHSLAFDATKKMVYMPGGREGRSKLVILKRVENGAAANPNLPQVATAER
jgi:YVTN family beta-propeller protein